MTPDDPENEGSPPEPAAAEAEPAAPPDAPSEPEPERGRVEGQAPIARRRIAILVALLAALLAAAVALVLTLPRQAARTAAPRDAAPPGPLLPRDTPYIPAPVKGTGSEQLTGIVVDGAGAPVAGIAVTAELELPAGDRALAPDADAGVVPVVVAVTGGDGRFTLEGLVAGRHHLTLEGNEVFTAEVRFVPVPSDELRLVVARRVAIVGTVLDRGLPIADAIVVIDGDTLGGTRSMLSGPDGRWAFTDLPEGSYRAWAWKGDLAARARRVPRLGVGPFTPVELTLEQATIVVGKVVDRQTGAGVSAAVVLTALPDADGEASDEAPRYARTNGDGIFRVEGVPEGRWTADAWAPGWITVGSVDFAAGRGTPTVELIPGGIVEGRVLGPDGQPMAGVTVSAHEEARAGGKEVSAAAADDRLRRFSGQAPLAPAAATVASALTAPISSGDLQFIPRGELGVLVGPIPYPPPAGAARTRQATIVDDTLAPATPAPGAGGPGPPPGTGAAPYDLLALGPLTVDPAYQPTWTTGADGTFRLTGVPAGTFWIVGEAPGHAPARERRTVALGQVVTGVELRMAAGVYVTGRVANQRGEPIAGAIITFRPGDGPARLGVVEGVSDADGRYRAGPLAGTVAVRATAYGHGEHTQELDLAPPPGGDPLADRTLDITLVVADEVLEGAVEDPTGLPVVGARVVVDGGPADGRTATTADGGRFRLTRLPPGALDLRVEHPGYPPQRFTESPGDGVRIRLVYGGGFEVLVLDHHTGEPVLGVTLTATGPGGQRRELDTSARGTASAVPIVPGTWTLTAAVPGYVRRSLTIQVPAGDRPSHVTMRDGRLELERGAVVAGIVRDRGGERAAGVRVVVRRGDLEVETRSDALGEFRLRDVPTGTVELVAEKAGARQRETLELRPGDERLSLDVTIPDNR